MRIVYITAGAAGSYCGACARDVGLARGLMARGHDVMLCPLYTPLRTDGPDPSLRRIFYGGINVYLQQRLGLFRRTPRFMNWLFDRPCLLRLVSRVAIRTRPEGLGEMTVSVLRGSEGLQRKEVGKLLDFLAGGRRPHVVNLSNSLLSGLVPAIKERLGVPVVCTLQGEEAFVQRLPEPHRGEALSLMRRHARTVDLFVAPYPAYTDEMSEFLAVARDRIRVIRPGIDVSAYGGARGGSAGGFRIGFLSRITPAKGIDLLCEAFCLLERGSSDAPSARRAILAVAGQLSKADRALWAGLRSRLEAEGLGDRLEFYGQLDFEGKLSFLSNCDAFCVPARFPERCCIAWIEALASGVPVVAPDRGGLCDVVELPGGGVLVRPDDAGALADAIALLRDDPDEVKRLGQAAAVGAAAYFSLDAMVEKTLEAYEDAVVSPVARGSSE